MTLEEYHRLYGDQLAEDEVEYAWIEDVWNPRVGAVIELVERIICPICPAFGSKKCDYEYCPLVDELRRYPQEV